MVDNEGTCQDVDLVLHFGLIDHVETSLAIVSVSNSREWLGIWVSNPKLLLGSVILAIVVPMGLLRMIVIPRVSVILSSSSRKIITPGCITNSSVAILCHVAFSSTSGPGQFRLSCLLRHFGHGVGKFAARALFFGGCRNPPWFRLSLGLSFLFFFCGASCPLFLSSSTGARAPQ